VIVSKREARGHTVTEARVLTDDERPRAIAELLSGAEVTLTALEHARAMLRELSKVGEGR
jgi:DNA repair ATPase RecN